MHLKIKLFTKGKRVVTDAAYLVRLVQPVAQVNRANPVDPVILVTPDFPVCLHQKFVFHQRQNLANLARLAHPDLPVHQETMVSSDQPAETARPAKTAQSVPPARPVPQAPPANPVATARAATPAETPKGTTPYPANAVRTANRANKVRPAPTVHRAKTVNRDRLGPAARPGPPVKTAKMATLATRDPLGRPANRENAAFAPNIAPWTEASSSKTARGDKLYNIISNILQNDKIFLLLLHGQCKLLPRNCCCYFTTTKASLLLSTLHKKRQRSKQQRENLHISLGLLFFLVLLLPSSFTTTNNSQ